MPSFFWNVILALAWASMVGGVTLTNLLLGYLLGLGALYVTRPRDKPDRYFRRVVPMLRFGVGLFLDVIVSTGKVALDAITPKVRSRPGVVAYPLDARTDTEIMLFATFVSYTPGTLVLDVSEDRTLMYIHGMFVEDRDRFCAHLKDSLERPLLEALR